MGCKGSKPFRYCGRKRKNRVEPLQGETSFNTDTQPAKLHTNNKVRNRFNVDKVFSEDFTGFKAGEITHKSLTPTRVGIPDGELDTFPTFQLRPLQKGFNDPITDARPGLKPDTSYIGGQIIESAQKHRDGGVVTINDLPRLPPLHMCKVLDRVYENHQNDVYRGKTVLRGQEIGEKRQFAAKGHRKPFVFNSPVLYYDIPTPTKRDDFGMGDDESPTHSNAGNTSTDVEGNENICREQTALFENGAIEDDAACSVDIPGVVTGHSGESVNPQRFRPTAAKGQKRNIRLFNRLSLPTLSNVIGKQRDNFGAGSGVAQDLVIEDIEEWEEMNA